MTPFSFIISFSVFFYSVAVFDDIIMTHQTNRLQFFIEFYEYKIGLFKKLL